MFVLLSVWPYTSFLKSRIAKRIYSGIKQTGLNSSTTIYWLYNYQQVIWPLQITCKMMTIIGSLVIFIVKSKWNNGVKYLVSAWYMEISIQLLLLKCTTVFLFYLLCAYSTFVWLKCNFLKNKGQQSKYFRLCGLHMVFVSYFPFFLFF